MPSEPKRASDARADQIIELLLSAPPTLGSGRLLAIDGPSGSGKSTIATAVRERLRTRGLWTKVVRMDDLYAGWAGLPGVTSQLLTLLEPLASGAPGSYRRWDWFASDWAESVTVAPLDVLILDGVGSGHLPTSQWVTTLVWVEADSRVRRDRALARDGEAFAPYWEGWAEAESAYFLTAQPRARADLIVVT